MVNFPSRDRKAVYKFLEPKLRDAESKDGFSFPAQYMFKDLPPEAEENVDPVAVVLDNMDRFGVERAMIGMRKSAILARNRCSAPASNTGCVTANSAPASTLYRNRRTSCSRSIAAGFAATPV